MHSLIVHNGRLGPVEASLSPGQAGLLTGWGVFTTLRIYDGAPFAWEKHWERMIRDAERTRVQIPFAAAEIREQLLWLINANGAHEAAARILFVRNTGGYWSTAAQQPTDSLIFTADLHDWPDSLRLTVVPEARHAASPLAGTKVLAWLSNVATYEEVQERGFHEGLLLNERGEVAECTSANVFVVRNGTVLTPPLDSGCLSGVTRQVLLEIAPQAGVELREQPLKLEDVTAAEEVFLTSTTRELIPVREIDAARWAGPWPGTGRLRAAFQAYVRDYIAHHRGAPARA